MYRPVKQCKIPNTSLMMTAYDLFSTISPKKLEYNRKKRFRNTYIPTCVIHVTTWIITFLSPKHATVWRRAIQARKWCDIPERRDACQQENSDSIISILPHVPPIWWLELSQSLVKTNKGMMPGNSSAQMMRHSRTSGRLTTCRWLRIVELNSHTHHRQQTSSVNILEVSNLLSGQLFLICKYCI